MIWIALSEKDTDNAALEKRLWDAADQFRANSGLKPQEYSGPILGLAGPFDFILANGSMSSNHSGKGDIRNGPVEAEKMNSNSWKVHHNIQS